jgi:predicted nucleic acid-binding protein
LVGSEATNFEISAMLGQEKRANVTLLASLAKVKVMADEEIIKRASELESIGFRAMDALHISSAENAADVMLTVDDGILSKARTNRRRIAIEIENPVRWLMNVLQD